MSQRELAEQMYDTQFTQFRLPPLTLQPIVENAVKHGRDPNAGPFHISVCTRNTHSGSVIVVADSGQRKRFGITELNHNLSQKSFYFFRRLQK